MLFLNNRIKSWKQFGRRVRSQGIPLLGRLDDYPDSVLVTGCQRSGTTVLSRVITQSDGMVDYWSGKDDELDAALILCGAVEEHRVGRYCFQTTYLNDSLPEYFEHDGGYKLIWVLRNPFSVIYSMLYHWKQWALDELFRACGAYLLEGRYGKRYRRFGFRAVPKAIRACLAYNGKVFQLSELKRKLDGRTLMVIEYDDLVKMPQIQLTRIFNFIDLDYREDYGRRIHRNSTEKKNRLSAAQQELVQGICLSVYEDARTYLS